MPRLKIAAMICLAGSFGISAASGQGLPSIPGASSLMKGVPNMSSISAGNAAGVLGYCVKNKVLGGSGASNVLGGLMKKPGITTASGYSDGQAGNIVTGNGTISLSQAPEQLKSQACNAVLKTAPKFL